VTSDDAARWPDAALAAALLAIDPQGLGGVVLRERAGPSRDGWLQGFCALLPAGTPVRRLPARIADDRLLGGLDLTATLRAGRPVAQQGLLAQSDGGVLVVPMAERMTADLAARLAAALDTGEVSFARDGIERSSACRIAIVALDEGIDDDERAPAALLDRLGLHLTALDASATLPESLAAAVDGARGRLHAVRVGDDALHALCATAQALGIGSMRAPWLALRAARAAAALAGRDEVGEAELQCAARLVLAPRATRLPPAPDAADPAPTEDAPPPEPTERETDCENDSETDSAPSDGALDDVTLQAARAAVPAHLLDRLRLGHARATAPAGGGAGARSASRLRGRPAGTRRGDPRHGARLDLVGTLRAAAPWQPLRRRERPRAGGIDVRADDLRMRRFERRNEATAVFALDASGSAALHRLAEAKGAVELLLADCYVRRDQVAVVAFRQQRAELLLPPTRSLVRAKRCLAAMRGGGATPLAAGIDAAAALGEAIRRGGRTPLLVILTDGRANIARDGSAGRGRAEDDALDAARRVRAARLATLLVDTAPQPQTLAERLAQAMDAAYLPLPHAGAATLSQAVQQRLRAPGAPA
jgi:magnesium chelatase subunit D